jgi:gas vesicle protein
MAKTLAGVLAVSIAALLFAGCGGREESSTQSTVKTTKSTAKQSLPSGVKSVEDLFDDFKELCDYASDLQSTVRKFKKELDAADVDSWSGSRFTPMPPTLNYRGICLGY